MTESNEPARKESPKSMQDHAWQITAFLIACLIVLATSLILKPPAQPVKTSDAAADIETEDELKESKSTEEANAKARQAKITAARSTIQSYLNQKNKIVPAGQRSKFVEMALARKVQMQRLDPAGSNSKSKSDLNLADMRLTLLGAKRKYGENHPYSIQAAIDLALVMETNSENSEDTALAAAQSWQHFVSDFISKIDQGATHGNNEIQSLVSSAGVPKICQWSNSSGEILSILLSGQNHAKEANGMAPWRVAIINALSCLELQEHQVQAAKNHVLSASQILRHYLGDPHSQSDFGDLSKLITAHLSCLASICKDDASLEKPYGEMLLWKIYLSKFRAKQAPTLTQEEKQAISSGFCSLTPVELHSRLEADSACLDIYNLPPLKFQKTESPLQYIVVVSTARDLRLVPLSSSFEIGKVKSILPSTTSHFIICAEATLDNVPWSKLLAPESGQARVTVIKSPEELLKKSRN